MDLRLADSIDGAREPISGIALPDRVAQQAQDKANELGVELRQRRKILTADQLACLVSPRAHFETEFELKEPLGRCYFFSIDGVLNGRKISGALFAGEVVLVHEDNFLKAQDLANRGLRSTVELLHEEYRTRELIGDDTPLARGLINDLAGRKARPSAPGRELSTNPYLKAVLAAELGKLPFKW